jgi:hypothetical protein
MTSTTVQRPVGERVELGRYHLSSGERILYGQRVDGVVRVTDRPAAAGRAYLVQRGFERDANDHGTGAWAALQGLIADYASRSEVLDQPAILPDREHLSADIERLVEYLSEDT